ncbi:MAG TPA: zf-HC2 domain-containing protein [Ktedonobacteraceae bacterium]|jgi:anti-sigma factor RsiW
MRCRDAKVWLTAQRDNDLAQPEVSTLQEHLQDCNACRTHEQLQQRLDLVLGTPSHRALTSISTERIMRAVERQKRITQQLEDLRMQQRTRVARLRIFTPRFAVMTYLTIGLISLALLALFIFNTDLVVKVLALLSDVIDALVTLAQYVQTGLALVIHDSWLLSGMALVLVILMGMWLRLMRHPQEA